MSGCECWMCMDPRFRSRSAAAPAPVLVEPFSGAPRDPARLN